MIDGDDDATLMRRHVDGDPDAFGEIVRRHRDRMWAVAVRTLGNPDDAADALQDAFVNAFRRAATFRAESAVTTWLYRIVVNACLDRVRRTAARPVAELTDDVEVSPPGSDPGTQTALRLDVQAALATLPPEQRVPLVLVDMEGYAVSEVAQMLGCPVGTVKSRCARARARLLPLLTSYGADESQRGNPVRPVDVPSTSASRPGGEPT
jgi:RNA polymerase sigma-70 factor (ECF subfamily)